VPQWGDISEELKTIYINQRPFQVTRNLFSALHRLRIRSFSQFEYLWVDSLCINQGAVLERNNQVALMGRIYAMAANVVVWLGEQSHDSNQAIDFMNKVYSASHLEPGSLYYSYNHESEEDFPTSAWTAVRSLFWREYWERTWIIQELELAWHVQIYCGNASFNWSVGSAFFDFVHGSRDLDLENISLKQRVLQSPAMQLLETSRLFRKRGMTLKHLLYHHENSKCSEKRDKIYGLLSLASDCKNMEMKADYSKSLLGVYRDAITLESGGASSTKNFQSPDLVYYSHYLQRILSLPWELSGPQSSFRTYVSPLCVIGWSCGQLTKEEPSAVEFPPPHMCAIEDSAFIAFKSRTWPHSDVALHPSGLSSTSRLHHEGPAKYFRLPKGQIVVGPQGAQIGDEICVFSKHDAAIVLRKVPDSEQYKLIGNAFVQVTEQQRKRRLPETLRRFHYCLPDYDLFPPPTRNLQNQFLIRMSVKTLQWLTRYEGT
jgi:Heterokaryon incompatibility protein (HET)